MVEEGRISVKVGAGVDHGRADKGKVRLPPPHVPAVDAISGKIAELKCESESADTNEFEDETQAY